MNKQYCHIWGSVRPNQVYEASQNSPLLTVWCASLENKIIGPYIFVNEYVTGQFYKRMLRIYVFLWRQNYSEETMFKQYEALFHYAVAVRQYLDHRIPKLSKKKAVCCPGVHAREIRIRVTTLCKNIWKIHCSLSPVQLWRDQYKLTQGIQTNDKDRLSNVYENWKLSTLGNEREAVI